MPSTLLFAINSDGRVFGLSTNGTKWREFTYLGLEFKQLSAVPNFLWAVGGDRQIYVHVHGLDVPIRVKEESYENERWTPFDGFSNKLLPTDRFNFSDKSGSVDRSLKKIRLPSMAWQWEDIWKLELTLNGQPLDHDGWTYAIDFPATYYPSKQWTSYVRRRKWYRYRKYIALNSWCAVAPLHKDPTKEPFISVEIGGNHLPGAKDGTMLVWAVTACGRVMFRNDVSKTCPEGLRWSSVPVPPGCEVSQVSVGATGLVWAVLQNGKAMVRSGVTRESLSGSSWVKVEGPEEDIGLSQISVGFNSVWAITKDNRVWFRKGINGESSGFCEDLAVGNGWVEMFGNMINISVASNDQVWAVGATDKTSVSQDDLMGKTWRALGAPTQLSRESSLFNFVTKNNETHSGKRHRSWASLNHRGEPPEQFSEAELDLRKTCHSAPPVAPHSSCQRLCRFSGKFDSSAPESRSSESWSSSSQSIPISDTLPEENLVSNSNDVREYCDSASTENVIGKYENISHPVYGLSTKEVSVPTRSWSPQLAGGSVVATEAHYAADSIIFESDQLTGIYSEHGEREDDTDDLYWADSDAFWLSVEAGACLINPDYLPNWFTDTNTNKKLELIKPWRVKILNVLKERLPKNLERLEHYEQAIENLSWVKTGCCQCLLPGEINFKDCVIELEWFSDKNSEFDGGVLKLSCSNKIESWEKFEIKDVTAIINCSVPHSPRLALFTSKSWIPLKLQFSTEGEYEEWKLELSSVCAKVRYTSDSPSSNSIWAITERGDIFVSDLTLSTVQQRLDGREGYFLEQKYEESDMPILFCFPAGFFPGHSVTISGCIHENAKKFAIDFLNYKEHENENADILYHFNPRFDEKCVVQNTRKNLIWGEEERSQVMPFQTGASFDLSVTCTSKCFIVSVNGKKFTEFSIRKNVESNEMPFITYINCSGNINVNKIHFSSNEVILQPKLMFWKQIEGHLRKVETVENVTWGVGFNNTAWFYKEAANSNKMCDTHYYYVYENQRWNPLTGYTSRGLPTDRFMWSDVTGKHKRTKENTTLLSTKWRWASDWAIDFQTPGGVDKEGWQYAVDFPSTYHGSKNLTDYVRRRRWFRCAKIETTGPWTELGFTSLSDFSLCSDENEIVAWAVASNGDVLFRRGVNKSCPAGISWEHVASDEQVISISCEEKQVWAVTKSGTALCRFGITSCNRLGDSWELVEAPSNTFLKQIALGKSGIWALDSVGKVLIRCGVSAAYPLGSHWRTVPSPVLEEVLKDDLSVVPTSSVNNAGGGFRQISAKNGIWAVTTSGRLACRLGVCCAAPIGFQWLLGIDANLLHIST